jgi:hypothetical protein
MSSIRKLVTLSLLLALFQVMPTLAQNNIPAESGVIVDVTDGGVVGALKGSHDAVLSAWQSGVDKGVKIEYAASKKYPGVTFDGPGDGWDLSAYQGVEIEVLNIGKGTVKGDLRVDNKGDWSKQMWNANHVDISPNETKTLRVTFGKTYGQPGYALNPKAVNRILFYVASPKEDGILVVKSLKAWK